MLYVTVSMIENVTTEEITDRKSKLLSGDCFPSSLFDLLIKSSLESVKKLIPNSKEKFFRQNRQHSKAKAAEGFRGDTDTEVHIRAR